MPTQRPSLGVTANPVSTFVAPVAASAQLYDQQSVNLALQFSQAFSTLSVSAANFAGALKKEDNQQQLIDGAALVDQNQKSYQKLVQDGTIKPSENPWLAIGAQQASGKIEGMQARAHFTSLYDQAAQQDPKFYDSPDSFNALAAQYVSNVHTVIGDATYMSSAFHEAFNPFIASMGLKHEETMVKEQQKKVIMGVGAAVAQGVNDMASTDPIISGNAVAVLQTQIDEMTRKGVPPKQINEAVVDYTVGLMKEGENIAQAEKIFASLKSGNAPISNTEYAKNVLLLNRGKIEANRDRLTVEEGKAYYGFSRDVISQVLEGKMTQDEAMQKHDAFVGGADRKISVTGAWAEEKRNYLQVKIKQALSEQTVQAQKDTEDAMVRFIRDRSTTFPTNSSFTEDQYQEQTRMELDSLMERLQVRPTDQVQLRNLLETQMTRESKIRTDSLIDAKTQDFWFGNPIANPAPGEPVNTGLSGLMAKDLDTYLDPKNQSSQPPSILEWSRKQNDYLISIGIQPNTEKAASANKQTVSRIYGALDEKSMALGAQWFPNNGSTLQELSTDPKEIKAQKAGLRAQVSYMKMGVGSAFGDDRFAIDTNKILVNGLNSRVENGINPELVDRVTAYAIAQTTTPGAVNLAISTESPNGLALKTELDSAVSRIRYGQNPADVIVDMVQRQSLGTSGRIDFTKPWDWTNMRSGSSSDLAVFAVTAQNQLQAMGVQGADANVYGVVAFKNATAESLARNANFNVATREASAFMQNNYFVVRGSLLPKNEFPGMSPAQIETWLDISYPNVKNPKLVPVNVDPSGSTLFAVRDEHDNIARGLPGELADAKFLLKSSDVVITPKMLPLVGAKEREVAIRNNTNPGLTPKGDTSWMKRVNDQVKYQTTPNVGFWERVADALGGG